MAIYIQKFATGNEWADGAWAEVLSAFGAKEWEGEDVDVTILVQPLHGHNIHGETNLADFIHPGGDIVYMFGPDNGHLVTVPSHDHSVYIPQISHSVTLWSHQAAAIVLWDRTSKLATGTSSVGTGTSSMGGTTNGDS